MALKDTWQNLQDAIAGDPNSGSDLKVKPINDIAKAVIDLENKEVEITVDSELDVNSENPVQNKVVTAKFNDVDEKIAELEPEIREEGDEDFFAEILTNNRIISLGVVNLTIQIGFFNAGVGFSSSLYFSTPAEISTDYSTFPENTKFKGDSVEDERFIPEANMRYTIVFDYDGVNVIGYVSGVSL